MLTCRCDVFTASTACAVVQCGCTVRLQKSPGLGAAFTPWIYGGRISHCLALPGEGQGKVPGAQHVHDEIFLSYLQNASQGEREGVMGPSQTGHVHQLLLSELSLEAAGEESRYGGLQLGQSSSGCWALHSGALLICMFLSTTAMKFINHAEGDSPVSQRPLVTGCTSQQYVERSKTASQQTITSRKSCTQQSSGLYALRFALFYSYHVSVGSRGHFMASSMLVTVHSPLLSSRCKQTIQKPDPK